MQTILDHELRDVYARLGEVVLVPMGNDDKVLANPQSFSETQNEIYLRRLAESTVGVILGPISSDLYALVFYTSAAETTFFHENPSVAETTVAEIAGRTVCFFRIHGFAPRSEKWSDGQWAGAGECVPLRAKGQLSRRHLVWITDCSPARIEFNKLVWTHEPQCLFTPEIVRARYGSPFFPDRKGIHHLNHLFWAYYFAYENDIAFSEAKQQFYSFNTDRDTWQELPRLTLEACLLDFLVEQSHRPEYNALAPRLDTNERKKIITELQVVALREFPEPVDNVKQFITECLEAHEGSDVTGKELYIAYGQFCKTRQILRVRDREFQKEITSPIEACYGVTRSHSIQRPDGNPRGFRHLRLKLSVYETPREKCDVGN